MSDVLSRITFENTGDDPPDPSRALQVSLSNVDGLTGYDYRDIDITPINDRPNDLDNITMDVTVINGSVVRMVLDMSDPDDDAADLELITTVIDGDDGVLLSNNPVSGSLRYTDSVVVGSGDSYTIVVSDGEYTSSGSMTLNVIDIEIDDTDPPTLQIDAPLTVEPGDSFVFTPEIDERWIADNSANASLFTYQLAGQFPQGPTGASDAASMTDNGGLGIEWTVPIDITLENVSFGLIIIYDVSGTPVYGYQPINIKIKLSGSN
ncbi:MAG: hypothetical protein HRU15_05415 [Planctomycetes bacterium]|nr:hypothetical protein [Planctomycetota bacterium]